MPRSAMKLAHELIPRNRLQDAFLTLRPDLMCRLLYAALLKKVPKGRAGGRCAALARVTRTGMCWP